MMKHLALLAILAWPAGAQQKVNLTTPAAEFPEPFTSIRGIRELADGRVIVSDVQDKVVQIVDFRAGSATKVGREGQGPEEYLLPASLFALPDGSALLQDMGNRRFLPIGADGKIGKPLSPPQPPASTDQQGPGVRFGGGMSMLISARGVDGRGNLYFQGLPLPPAEGEPAADSVPLMRWDRVKPSVDTVAWLPVPASQRPTVTRGAGGATMMVRIGTGGAWPKQTQWSVAPDGRLAIVSPEPYQVSWLTGRSRTAGPVVAYNAPKVTEADRKAWIDQQSRTRPVMVTFGGPGAGRAAPQVAAPNPAEIEWPETLPAFSGLDAVMMSPEGEVWVRRVLPASVRTTRYDVFDGQGRLIKEVTLKPRSRVIGFGRASAYVVRSDEDDLQYLERYQLSGQTAGR